MIRVRQLIYDPMNALIRNAILASAAISLFGCGNVDDPTDVTPNEDILLVGSGIEPKTLDPQLNMGSAEGRIISSLGEGLVTQDPRVPYEVRPGIAESWSHDSEFRVWTFHLRPDARWSDGSPLTAEDILYSWRRILTPGLGAPLAEFYYPVKGAEAFNKGEISDFKSVGIKAVDQRTIVISGTVPMPYLLNMLATYVFFPVQKKAVEANGRMTDRTNNWFETGRHVGNGPFMLSAWKPNQYVEVKKNPHYWDADNVKIDGIRFFAIENQKTELNSFLSGRLHMTSAIPPEHLKHLKETRAEAVRSDRQPGSSFYVLNSRSGALADKRVRQALSLAVDRGLLTERVLGGGQQPIGGLVPKGLPQYSAIPASPVNADKARRLLAEAGYPGGRGFPHTEILINTSQGNQKQAEAVQSMWKSALGIEIEIRNVEWKVFLDALQSNDFDIARASWTGLYPGPGAYLSCMTSDDPSNYGGWSNARYDALISKGLATSDQAQGNRYFREAELILTDEIPVIPLYTNVQNTLVDPRVSGWGRDGAQNYKFVSLKAR